MPQRKLYLRTYNSVRVQYAFASTVCGSVVNPLFCEDRNGKDIRFGSRECFLSDSEKMFGENQGL